MSTFIQQLITGLSIGSIYALLAVGYALIYSIFDFTNFAFGSMMMCCAYAAFFAIAYFELPLILAVVVVLVFGMPVRPDGAGRLPSHAQQERLPSVPDDRRYGR